MVKTQIPVPGPNAIGQTLNSNPPVKGTALRALIVEDNESDVLLLVRALTQAGFEVAHRQVENAENMSRALHEPSWDVVFLDYHLPEFSALEALGILKSLGHDTPCIVISGVVGEEAAVEVMRAGAHDFITKYNLSRLIPVLQRELSAGVERQTHLRARESLRQLGKLKNDFLASVSHELQTPLTAILGYLKLLQGKPGDGMTELQVEFVRTAFKNSERLHNLVSNLLDLSKLESHGSELVIVRTPAEPLLETAVKSVLESSEPRDISIKQEISPKDLMIRADIVQINRVLINLLSNAVKFTPPGGTIDIQVCPDRGTSRAGILIQVRDTGVGIPPGDLEKVFDKFYQVDNTATRNVGGTGLGLAICKGLVEAHSGKIWVESQVGAGSTFNVFLPD